MERDENMDIISYFESENQSALLGKIAACDWGAAKFLTELLEKGTFHQTLGGWGHLFLLMDGDQAVGFVFYGLLPEENRAYLCRYMMDVKYQNQGYGKAFLPLVLELIRSQYGQNTVYTSVHDENPHAKHLYEEFGFQPTEEMDGEERVYVLFGETI